MIVMYRGGHETAGDSKPGAKASVSATQKNHILGPREPEAGIHPDTGGKSRGTMRILSQAQGPASCGGR